MVTQQKGEPDEVFRKRRNAKGQEYRDKQKVKEQEDQRAIALKKENARLRKAKSRANKARSSPSPSLSNTMAKSSSTKKPSAAARRAASSPSRAMIAAPLQPSPGLERETRLLLAQGFANIAASNSVLTENGTALFRSMEQGEVRRGSLRKQKERANKKVAAVDPIEVVPDATAPREHRAKGRSDEEHKERNRIKSQKYRDEQKAKEHEAQRAIELKRKNAPERQQKRRAKLKAAAAEDPVVVVPDGATAPVATAPVSNIQAEGAPVAAAPAVDTGPLSTTERQELDLLLQSTTGLQQQRQLLAFLRQMHQPRGAPPS